VQNLKLKIISNNTFFYRRWKEAISLYVKLQLDTETDRSLWNKFSRKRQTKL